jgi:8-oxo-dGTP pyrophosphatase MutT (NUDIX family)
MLADDMADSLDARLRALPYTGRSGSWHGVPAAVLLAFSPVAGDNLDIVLVRRPDSMRSHAGQVSFPGGAVDAGDADGTAAALREADEEVGLDPAAVEVLGTLARVPLAVSGFDVLPVVGLWPGRAPLHANPVEVDVILRPSLRQLADPANHGLVPLRELIPAARIAQRQLPPDAASPVFRVDGHVVWGFTAGILSVLLDELGLATPPLPPGWPRPGPSPPP